MAKKRQSMGLRILIAFVLLIVVTGIVLSATGNFDNPFAAISELTAVSNLVEGQEPLAAEDDAIQPLPPTEGLDNALADVNLAQDTLPLDDSGPDEGHVELGLIGNVLFDLWFFCAATAVVVVVQKILTISVKVIQTRVLSVTRK